MPPWSTIKLVTPYQLRRLTISPRNLTNSAFSYSNLLQTRHMTRLTGKALADDIANTILEDSEPERQAEEVRQKEQHRKRPEQRKRNEGEKLEAQAEESREVIVVAESERKRPTELSLSRCIESSVIEISDTTASTLEGVAAPVANLPWHDLVSSQSSEQEIQELLAQPPQSHQVTDLNVANDYNGPIDLAACISSSPAEQRSLVPKLDIARFAFGKKAGPSTVTKLGFALSRQLSNTSMSENSLPAAKASKPTKSAAPLPSFASSFTTSQLTTLSKCVVCNLAWTVRKTVPVKMSHIKTCAYKNGWKEETIIVRLMKEIGNIPTCTSSNTVEVSKKSKGKGKAVADQTPQTFLEDVVNEAAPKKRRKKVQDVDVVTVLTPQDAHAAIMERAKALLGPPAPPAGSAQYIDSFPTTQIFPPSRLGSSGRSGVFGLGMLEDQVARTSGNTVDPEYKVSRADIGKLPSPTQTFHTGVLVGKSTKQSVLYEDENDNDEQPDNDAATGMPPATQEFRQSTLATKFGQGKQSLLDWNETTSTYLPKVVNPVCPPKSPQSTMKPLMAATRPRTFNVGAPLTSSSVNDEHFHPPVTSQKRLADLDRRLAKNRTDLQRGKVQLDPYPIPASELVVTKITPTKRIKKTGNDCTVSKGKRKARDGSSSSSRSPRRSRSKSRSRSRKPSSRRKSRSPWKAQRTPEAECGDNETLDEDLYRIIKEDKALYERILRYEPIHFDVFFKLTGIQEMDGRGLKFRLKLRAFLDKQAINFYGDSVLASNRSRYK